MGKGVFDYSHPDAPPETPQGAEQFDAQLRKEWMAQDKTLDYTNWLQDEVRGLREEKERLKSRDTQPCK